MELGGFTPGEHKTTMKRVTRMGCLRDRQHGRVIDEKERAIETGKQPLKGRLRTWKKCPKGKGKGDFSNLGVLSVKSQLSRVWEGQGRWELIEIVKFRVKTHPNLLTLRADVGHEDYLLNENSDQRVLNITPSTSPTQI